MKTSSQELATAALLVAGTVFAATTPATVAPSNVVTLDFAGNSNDDVAQLSVTGANRIYMENTSGGVFGLDLTNPLGNTFGARGRFLPDVGNIIVRADGSFLDMEASQGATVIATLDAHGTVIATSTPVSMPLMKLAGAQPDGKLLVGGAFDSGCHGCFYPAAKVIRLNADGTVDQTFNSVQIGAGHDTGVSQATTLSDGKILLAFNSGSPVIGLLNSDGTLAPGFGLNSMVTFTDAVHAVAADSQNRIYVVSGTNKLQRLLEDGSFDSAFDATAAAAATGRFTAMKLDSMQRPVVFGPVPAAAGTLSGSAFIARLTSTGALDTTFATTGFVFITLPKPIAEFANGPCTGDLQTDDKPVIACSIQGEADHSIPQDVALARYNVDGTADTTLASTIPDFQYYPDAFTFAGASAAYGTAYVVSNPVTITGTNVPTSIRATPEVQGGSLSVDCTGQYTNLSQVIEPGHSFCVRGSASIQPSGTAVVAADVGGRQATFTITSTNTAATTAPAAFSFTNQTDVELSAVLNSNVITVSGITGFATVTVSGDNGFARYIIGCGSDKPEAPASGLGKIAPGQTICIQQIASSTPGVGETATLTVGGVSADFTITTKANTPPSSNTGTTTGGGGGGAFDELSLAALAALSLAILRQRYRVQYWRQTTRRT